ncbi:helix-turn-helix transcriptional regulator [Mesorhizobium sp. NPDC059054]|uniref:helix-turn-helix transcriptional regulator n=1 Tax=Mesorhizobium sp. NPDC059054 TaxID=3346711 RepID=UPI003678C270
MRAVVDYDEARIVAIARDVSEAIDRAAFDDGDWNDVPTALAQAFPGSFGAFWNINYRRTDLNFLATHNIAPDFLKSYAEHFAFINPWTAYWENIRNGTVAASEVVAPARSFDRTEFYNDWLKPQKDVEAAAGLKLVGGQGEIVTFLMHYPLSKSDRYEAAAVEVLSRVRGSVDRSISLARLLRKRSEMALSGAALLERPRCAAFVMDTNRAVRDANALAAELFSRGSPVSALRGRVSLSDKEADARFGQMLRAIGNAAESGHSVVAFRDAGSAWEVLLAPLHAGGETSGILTLLPPRRLVLVLVTELKPAAQEVPELSNLAPLFGLTKAEIAFCRKLLAGESVSEIANGQKLSVETARTRMKSILHKTDSPRQSHLMLLLSRFS